MSNYNSSYLKGWGAMYPPEELIRFVNFIPKYSNLNIQKSDVVDLGCGIGGCSWFLANNFRHILAIDNSIEALKKVPKVMSYFNINKKKITTRLMDFKNFQLDKNYNFIIDNRSLYNQSFSEFLKSFKYLKSKLNKDGLFFTSFFGKKTSIIKQSEKVNNNEYIVKRSNLKIGGRQVFVGSNTMNKYFKNNGFKICNYENILIFRDKLLVEKHVYYLKIS